MYCILFYNYIFFTIKSKRRKDIKMIVHASTKMDISNYLPWLQMRLQEGFFDRDFNSKEVHRISLKNIEELILYTRTPQRIYRNRDLFSKYNPTLVTFMSQYDNLFEPKIKNKEKIFECIKKARKHFNKNYFGYGPIFYTASHDKNWHLAQFSFMCHDIAPYVDGIYISFSINEQCQKAKNMKCRPLDAMEQSIILREFEEIAEKNNVSVELMRYEEDFSENEVDIGETNCCPYACKYCSYITNGESATCKYKSFNQGSTMLYGIIAGSQKIVNIDVDKQMIKENDKQYQQESLFDLIKM